MRHGFFPPPVNREMPFTARIQNLGKLSDATVRVDRLTVLAGVNNTGKSFFSKAMYSVFDTMNANPVEIAVKNRLRSLRGDLLTLSHAIKDLSRIRVIHGQPDTPALPPMPHLESMSGAVARIAATAAKISFDGDADVAEDASVFERPHPDLARAAAEVEKEFELLKPELERWMSSLDRPPFSRWFRRRMMGPQFVDMMEQSMSSARKLGALSRDALLLEGISLKVSDEFSENFQVGELTDLAGGGGPNATVAVDGVCSFDIDPGADLRVDVTSVGLLELQRFSRVIYLESPVMWKLKEGLERLGRRLAPGQVPDAPGHFYNLVDALGKTYRGKAVASEEIQRLTKEVVRGKIVIGEAGELLFAEEGAPRPRPLSLVSTGVINLGALAMLVERKIVDKDSFLFIDEPEAHLHPAWQVEMIRLLFALAREGVHVVIATHSVDIVKGLEVHLKNNPVDKELTALNHFTREGVVNGDKDFSDKLSDIMIELTRPFHLLRLGEF